MAGVGCQVELLQGLSIRAVLRRMPSNKKAEGARRPVGPKELKTRFSGIDDQLEPCKEAAIGGTRLNELLRI